MIMWGLAVLVYSIIIIKIIQCALGLNEDIKFLYEEPGYIKPVEEELEQQTRVYSKKEMAEIKELMPQKPKKSQCNNERSLW